MSDVLDIQVTPLSPACGAEIRGVDLSRPLSPETVKAIRDAWNKHIVLVFRGQQVSEEDQLRFASYFGNLGERKRAKTQLAKKIEEANRWLETIRHYATMVDKTIQQLTTMQGVLRNVDEQLARLQLELVPRPVHGQRNLTHCEGPPWSTGTRVQPTTLPARLGTARRLPR